MSINDALDRACEGYITNLFEVFIEAVASAEGNEELIATAAERFRAGVNLGVQILTEAKQLVKS